ncbi:MAG: sugar transferase, partial [Candidatus Staskawiczbacteria bacterium]|nr:sugar transferase [Candidatus Staskawiczbacteria bacterium]
MNHMLIIKRIFDMFFSLLGLIILSPLFLVVAILVKADSRGRIFFMQERIGKDGKSFYPFKFRTMIEGAASQGMGNTVSKDDERITSLGKFLRKWGIDELPQLLNVLKGEMSLVGPRPTLRYQIEKYNDFQRKRLLA